MAGGGSSVTGGGSADGGTGSSAAGGGSADGGDVDGSSSTGGGSSDAGGAGSLAGGGEGASSVLVGVSLGLDGVEDAACDGVPSEAEEDSPPREGAAAASSPVDEDAESGEAVLLDGLEAFPTGLPDGQGVAELAATNPSRTLRSTVFSP